MVRITVTHGDADTAAKIAQYLYSTTQRKAQATVAEHSTQVLADYSAYEIDTNLREDQESSEANLKNAKASVEEKQKALDELLKNPITAEAAGISYGVILKQAVKYGILGLVVGFVIGCVLALFSAMLGGKLQNTADVLARYKFPLLGTLPQDTKGRWFDQWIRNLEGESNAAYEEAAQVAAANLRTVAGEKKVMLVSTGEASLAKKLAASLNGLAPSQAGVLKEAGALSETTDKLSGRKANPVEVAGNILEHAAAVELLKDADAVVLIEARGKAKMEQIDGEVLRLEALNKEILGIVLC